MSHRLVLSPRAGVTPVISALGLDAVDPLAYVTRIEVRTIRFLNGSTKEVNRDIDIVPGVPRAMLVEGDMIITYNLQMGSLIITENDRTIKDVIFKITLSEGTET